MNINSLFLILILFISGCTANGYSLSWNKDLQQTELIAINSQALMSSSAVNINDTKIKPVTVSTNKTLAHLDPTLQFPPIKKPTIKKNPKKINKSSPKKKAIYSAKKGDVLEQIIFKWSKANNYTLSWNVLTKKGNKPVWRLPADITINENYYNAVITLLEAYRTDHSGVKFTYKFFRNKVLLVATEAPVND